ncbi:histone-lysine N-methyltransferase EHMT2-like isoform X3 [Myxocyprinus asiaticus]|uniref:histone-lysine N-methyltransferase EHMT2-like isoform X3 n=1 Tax=Myxocyprinus asiaticus TaxID=70543 RepID=UPI0022238742|nr:histone-lysine N-methyltransferase EHMT2-like isoform X3 [Myxocyprinus asiaticus]
MSAADRARENSSDGSSSQSKHEAELFPSVKSKPMEETMMSPARQDEGQHATPGKTFSGSGGKTASSSSSSSSSSSLSSPSSASSRAKMSVCGPGSKTASSSSSSSLSSSSCTSHSTANSPPKVHRARKTMTPRPPFAQMKSTESMIAAATPEKPNNSSKTDSETAVKKRKVALDSDGVAPPAGTPEKVPRPSTDAPLIVSPVMEKVEAVAMTTKENSGGWLEDLDDEADEEDFHLLYNTYSGDDVIYSDSKSEDGTVEEPLDAEHLSDHSSESDQSLAVLKKAGGQRDESPWKRQGKGKARDRHPAGDMETNKGVDSAGAVTAAAAVDDTDYTEVPLDSLDISAADSISLSPHADGSDAETERLEELPLCSCRMEAPRVDGFSSRSNRNCMAIDSINGELVGCTNVIVKGETMRPSSRVSLMVLCETHRSHMVKHHCCPGCGYFCLSGTFLECCPDIRIAHRFHRGCVSVLGGRRSRGGVGVGLLFCPHCGEDASEAREVTIPPAAPSSGSNVITASASSTTATPSLLPSALAVTSRVLNNERRTGEPINARMRCRGDVRKGADLQPQPPNAIPGGAEDAVNLGDGGVDSVGPSLTLPNGKPICPSALPPGDRRAALQRAILTQDTERRKKLRFHPRQLYPAAKQGEVQRVLLMLMEGIDPSYQSDSQNRRSALHAAAQRGLLEICYLLVQAGAKVDTQDKMLRTPLLEAIVNNHVDVVKYLIQSGACVYHVEDGSTGLHHAAKLGNLEVVTLLLSTGQVDLNAQDSGGWTPVIWAAEHRHIDVIRALLNRGADVTIRDKEMNVCLHWASFAGSAEIAELVLNAGCPLSSVNLHGDTPLHIAAREGYIDCVTLFLSRGADIDIMNKEGDTPLSLARSDTPAWVALQINRKLRRGISNRVVRTERIICSDVAQGYENIPIPCVNGVDDEGCPSDYKYIAENCETSAMNIDRNITHLQHCSCTDDCSSSNCLCGQLSIRCWYDKDHRLLQEFNKIEPPLIFECNMACSCHKTCKNRVVQAGIKVRLQLYRTEKMGWGVRALQDIPQGSFICEYVGELISDAEADVREDDSYLFDLDNKDGEVYCIDARYYGNISRFINHLCDPNIIPVRVFMLHQDLRFPRIAFFSSRDIFTGQELGFDYGDRFWDIKSKYFTCQCGSEKCKHSAEAIALEQSRLARLENCPESASEPGLPVLAQT